MFTDEDVRLVKELRSKESLLIPTVVPSLWTMPRKRRILRKVGNTAFLHTSRQVSASSNVCVCQPFFALNLIPNVLYKAQPVIFIFFLTS